MKIIKTFPFSGKKYAKECASKYPDKIFLDEYYFLDQKFFYYDYFFTYFKFFNISNTNIAKTLNEYDSKFLIQCYEKFLNKITLFKLKYNLIKYKYKDDSNVIWLCSTNFLPEIFSAPVNLKTLHTYENFENKFKKYFNSVYDLYYNDVDEKYKEEIIKTTELACKVYKDFFNIKEDIYDLKFSYDMDSKCIENTQAKDLVILKNNLIDDNIL